MISIELNGLTKARIPLERFDFGNWNVEFSTVLTHQNSEAFISCILIISFYFFVHFFPKKKNLCVPPLLSFEKKSMKIHLVLFSIYSIWHCSVTIALWNSIVNRISESKSFKLLNYICHFSFSSFIRHRPLFCDIRFWHFRKLTSEFCESFFVAEIVEWKMSNVVIETFSICLLFSVLTLALSFGFVVSHKWSALLTNFGPSFLKQNNEIQLITKCIFAYVKLFLVNPIPWHRRSPIVKNINECVVIPNTNERDDSVKWTKWIRKKT